MTVLTIRDVHSEDAAELADLLNAIIAQGGTTALETAFSATRLDETYLTGPAVHCCFVAANDNELLGFQTLVGERHLPEGCADIATFTQIDGTQKGVGSQLFKATKERSKALGLTSINACIRADNVGGLAFYNKQGFHDHSVDEAIPLKDGTPVDRINKRFSL